ncbi:RNA pseudouridine synthase superfamily protein [Babesia ovis]|uniref:RNA pseudouridine synthase superfamily protein n=1 Tax=Babesia ovis TaxID=5869 RepID=A0A9W5T911_BABOV|nr:RNA pseudouridine synthase superfamily protein [Babesia ovis]
MRSPANERQVEEYSPEPVPPEGGEQDSFYHDDPQCPCYVCTNGVIESKSNISPDEASTGVEFAVRSFWRLAKTQNDVESPTEGHCRGFYYKLLLHPRGTAGTDSEASHLSVFVEASVQDWYPQYWVFPNVRFELTVVNFKDPKQSVTSWAHWSFSSDATSRGWQKMISHSRLTKASGFMDEDGTVLVRGKAEPPYSMLWSNSPLYHPHMMWEYIPNRAQRELSAEINPDRQNSNKYKRDQYMQEPVPCHPSCTYDVHVPNCLNANNGFGSNSPRAIADKEPDKDYRCYEDSQNVSGKIQPLDGDSPMTPTQSDGQEPPPLPTQSGSVSDSGNNHYIDDSDYMELNAEDTLMHLQPDEHPGISHNTILRFLDSVIPALQPTLDADLLALMTHILYHLREFRKRILMWTPPETMDEGAKSGNGIIMALQKTFAYMQLYPFAAACKAYKLTGVDPRQLSKYYLYELLPKTPNLKNSYVSSECDDNMGTVSSSLSNPLGKSPNGKYDSNVQPKKSVTRQSRSTPLPWNRVHIPTPLPKPSDVPGYDDVDEFSNPNCCYFDGGRYEWELKRRMDRVGDTSTDQATSEANVKNANMFGVTDEQQNNYKMLPGTLSYSIGNRADVFDKLMPPPPNIKALLKAMHMSDLQVLETQDQLISIHTELFSMLLMDLAAAKRNIKQKRLMSGNKDQPESSAEYSLPWYLRDQTDLEMTCKSLFSGAGDNEGLFHNCEVNDIASIYIRCKHSHSLQKALENTTKTMSKFPEVLFFYLYPTKNAKKGELFDVPLRLDCTNLCEGAATPEDQFDVTGPPHSQKMATSGDNTCDSRGTAGPMVYCEYSDEDDEDEDDDAEDILSDGFENIDGECKKGKHSAHVKWYSLYALILREGDVRIDGTGGNFHSLLLRPEEDGPWYRIGEGRVEKLTTKMDFTEWKCHRDFFCAAAIYVAEDYIDMLQVGEVDLTGNIKSWNPKLFYETLAELGVSEEDIANPTLALMAQKQMEAAEYRSQASDEGVSPSGSVTPTELSNSKTDYTTTRASESESLVAKYSPNSIVAVKVPSDVAYEDDFVRRLAGMTESGLDLSTLNLIYNRKVGQRHPRLGTCCELHGYSMNALNAMHEAELSLKKIQPVSEKEICRRLNRAEAIRPFMKWIFYASKENNVLLNGVKEQAEGKLLVKFLQQRERFFEEEFCDLISEILLKEIGEHMALHNVYHWESDKSWCGCPCGKCSDNCPALLLTENGRFAGEDLKALLKEPSTILFRNIQILRCHLEYFCKDCWNLSLQDREVQQISDIHGFKATSERSALFLIECIWDACVRYTHDCRTILYLKAISVNPSAAVPELGINKVSTLMRPNAIPATKQTGSVSTSTDQNQDLFVFDGTLSQNIELLEGVLVDCYDTKYDLTLAEEIRIMRYFDAKYHLPTVSQMRKFLREHHVLVYSFVRPHELLRAYLEVKHPGENIKGEIEHMVPNVVWNDSAFDQKVNIKSLSDETKAKYGIKNGNEGVRNSFGHTLCDVYEELITKMLLHMQDAERGLGNQVFDYMYTCADVARIVNAIEAECIKTSEENLLAMTSKTVDDQCTCEALSHDFKVSPILSTSSYFSDFGMSRGPFLLDFVDIVPASARSCGLTSESVSISGEFVDATKLSDVKRKAKTKDRKKNVDSGANVIPPFDHAVRDVLINQKNAHAADPKLFPDLNEVIKYPNGVHSTNHGALATLRRWGEANSLLYHQNIGYDFNIAAGFADMLKLENHGLKAGANPLLESRKYNETQAQRIKHAYELGIITSSDLAGAEGFASEEKFVPTKRILVYHEYTDEKTGKKMPVRVEHLYWGIRRLMMSQIPADIDSPFLQTGKTKKAKGNTKCICGGPCESEEYECPRKMRWKPLPRDCFVMYALRPDNNPIRRGRRRFTFMHPDFDLSHYTDSARRRVNPKAPDIVLLIVGAPVSLCTAPSIPFPLTDDSEYPLLLFKWMCSDAVDLICYGAVVCDAKKQLQHYIFEWLLPLLRESGMLPKLGPNEKEDIERYQILEECSVRTVQNVRRWSCAIRKINKRTGDIIIAQVKRMSDSPATLKLRETTEFMHTVKELEALEFLPPAQQFDENNELIKSGGEQAEAVDETHKLGKKKKQKKKVTKTAIPSNKKSTFSKTIAPVESESDEDVEPVQEVLEVPKVPEEPEAPVTSVDVLTAVEPIEVEAPVSSVDEEEDIDEEESTEEIDDDEGEESDDEFETEDDDFQDDYYDDDELHQPLDVCAIVDEAQEVVASSRTVVDRAVLEKRGLPSGRMQDFLNRVDMPQMLYNEVEKVTEMCSYIQRVMEEELKVSLDLGYTEPSKDQVVITVGPRTRTCVDILLCLIKCMNKNGPVISSFRNLIDAIYEQAPLSAAGIACYALSAMGNLSIIEYLKSKAAMEFVKDLVHKMAEQSIAHSWSIFGDSDEKCAVSSMLICLYLYCGVNEPINRVCDQDSDLLFLMNVHRDRLSMYPEDEEEEHFSSVGFRIDAFEQFIGFGLPGNGGILDQVQKNNELMKCFRSPLSPFGDAERIAEVEKLVLQELKIWWFQREAYLSSIKSMLEMGSVTFEISHGDVATLRRHHADESRPLPISIAEFKYLKQCCRRYPEDLSMVVSDEIVRLGFSASMESGPMLSNLDALTLVETAILLGQLVESRNIARAVSNVSLEESEATSMFADLDEMRLWSNQTALVTMSVRRSGTLDPLVTADIDTIVHHYYARTVRHIPQPPKLPPQQVQLVGNHS